MGNFLQTSWVVMQKPLNFYEHSLRAMERLLTTVGEEYWANRIREDIDQWQTRSDTTHHLSAYGGMGSFNDIGILQSNDHNVTEAQEPWVNTLFEWLKSVCYYLAQHPNQNITAEKLSKAVGRYDSALAAFVGGDKAPASMRRYANEPRELTGSRCLRCGYSEASNRDIDDLIAEDVIPVMVFRSCEKMTLDKVVDDVLNLDIPGLAETHQELAAAVTASEIVLNDREDWMRPCPHCGSEDTATYRWNVVVAGEFRFEPSDNNLAMRE